MKTRIIAIALTMVSAAAAGQAQEIPEPSGEGPAIQLSLDEAISRAARANLGVQIQDFQYMEARQRLKGSEGPFDWFTTALVQTSTDETIPQSEFDASLEEQDLLRLGVSQLLPTGGSYNVGFTTVERSTNSRFSRFDPVFFSGLDFNFTQPLFRDFGVDVTTRNIRIARNNLGISREEFRRAMIETVLSVEQAYYDLIFARQNLEVRRQSLGLARDQERITQIRIDVGASAPLDILQPRVAVATRQEEIIVAEASVRDAEDRLRTLMNLPADQWASEIIPTEELEVHDVDLDTVSAVALAWELRPEVRQSELQTASSEIGYRFARNQVLPQVDLQIDYGLTGVSGTELERDPVTGEVINRLPGGGLGDAVDQVLGFDLPGWTVGVNFAMPVRNIGARAEARRAELEMRRLAQSEEQLRQDIAVEVRQALRDIERFERQIEAARAAREAAEQNVDAERKRFDNGMTTNFNVLEVQQELADARSREIAAQVNFQKAVSFFHRSVGNLLQYHGIEVDEPELEKAPFSSWQRVKMLNYGFWSDDFQDE
ncbi:MAG: TolC family protein [Acidobacteria bacterium]|nr:TolC family protein [Acidobacteriota bacterium]